MGYVINKLSYPRFGRGFFVNMKKDTMPRLLIILLIVIFILEIIGIYMSNSSLNKISSIENTLRQWEVYEDTK